MRQSPSPEEGGEGSPGSKHLYPKREKEAQNQRGGEICKWRIHKTRGPHAEEEWEGEKASKPREQGRRGRESGLMI